jgi:hypothetical protein
MTTNIQKTSKSSVTSSQAATQALNDKFNTFVRSLGDVLFDITALEVNTMVVSQITGSKFNPDQAYRAIYAIPLDEDDNAYFDEHEIPVQLRDRYRRLRRKLEADYRQAIEQLMDTSSPHHGRPLPDPDKEMRRLQDLFKNATFTRALRKMIELKASLDSDSEKLPKIDLIFAQTVVQLDGDIINRYHEALFQHPKKDEILEIHKQGVMAGEDQWEGLLGFIVSLMQNILKASSSSASSLFSRNGQR